MEYKIEDIQQRYEDCGWSEKLYNDMVDVLRKPGDVIKDELCPAEADLWHMAYGFTGECPEIVEAYCLATSSGSYDCENLIEELGDLEYYARGVLSQIDESYEGYILQESVYSIFDQEGPLSSLLTMIVHSGALADAVKKRVIYNKEVEDHQIFSALVTAVSCAYAAVRSMMISSGDWDDRKTMEEFRDDVRNENFKKLALGRYATGYSDKAAQQRKDKQNDED